MACGIYLISLIIFSKGNFPPKIQGPQAITATVNQTIEINITAEHNSSDYFVFTVENFLNVKIVANTSQFLVIQWHPTSTKKVSTHR